MKVDVTVLKKGNDCQFFVDVFPDELSKFCMSAKPATFVCAEWFAQDSDKCGPLLILPLVDAEKMAQEILKL